jgi:hypothetical protein
MRSCSRPCSRERTSRSSGEHSHSSIADGQARSRRSPSPGAPRLRSDPALSRGGVLLSHCRPTPWPPHRACPHEGRINPGTTRAASEHESEQHRPAWTEPYSGDRPHLETHCCCDWPSADYRLPEVKYGTAPCDRGRLVCRHKVGDFIEEFDFVKSIDKTVECMLIN